MDPEDDRKLRGLMVAYQAGEYDAFEDLYRALRAPVRVRLLARMRDPARLEDLIQEVFLQLHRARHTYDPAYPVVPWVLAIARHVALMDRRTASRRPQFVPAETAPEPGCAAEGERFINGSPMRDALASVPAERRRAMLLHHLAGWSFADIARRFGIRESAARLRSSRGVQQLRHLLKR